MLCEVQVSHHLLCPTAGVLRAEAAELAEDSQVIVNRKVLEGVVDRQ